MFKIEILVNGVTEHKYIVNKKEDDILRFLPAIYSSEFSTPITKNDITVYFMSEADCLLIRTMDHKTQKLDISTVGEMRVLLTSDDSVIHTLTGTKLSQWSYDENGNFLGNN